MFQVGDIWTWKDGKGPWGASDRDLPRDSQHLRVYQRPSFRIVALSAAGYTGDCVFTIQDLVGGDPLPMARFWLEEEATKDEFLTAVHRVRS